MIDKHIIEDLKRNHEATNWGRLDNPETIYSRALNEIERMRAWIMRTASDDNLKHRAGYHGRRVMLEAAAVLNGETIPKPHAGGER